MVMDLKPYYVPKGVDAALDREFSETKAYGKIRPGQRVLFWKAGLKWYHIPYSRVQRIYRQIEPVYGKLCCGGRSYLIERLILVLTDGQVLSLHIGDEAKHAAEELFRLLQDTHPELNFGKVQE